MASNSKPVSELLREQFLAKQKQLPSVPPSKIAFLNQQLLVVRVVPQMLNETVRLPDGVELLLSGPCLYCLPSSLKQIQRLHAGDWIIYGGTEQLPVRFALSNLQFLMLCELERGGASAR